MTSESVLESKKIEWIVSRWSIIGGIADRREVHIERVISKSGEPVFKISSEGACLSTEFEWEIEPGPSWRDDDFRKRCRYSSFDAAALHFSKFVDLLNAKGPNAST